jgi:hypothetical protein
VANIELVKAGDLLRASERVDRPYSHTFDALGFVDDLALLSRDEVPFVLIGINRTKQTRNRFVFAITRETGTPVFNKSQLDNPNKVYPVHTAETNTFNTAYVHVDKRKPDVIVGEQLLVNFLEKNPPHLPPSIRLRVDSPFPLGAEILSNPTGLLERPTLNARLVQERRRRGIK